MAKQSNQGALIEFNPKLPKLSQNEKKVLKLLVEAAKLIAPIYLEQEKQANKLDKREIEKAAKKDPSLLSPYTVVEKVDGKLNAVPYHIKYAKLLKPVAEELEKAAGITDNKEFGRALKLQAKALLNGFYDEATVAWLKIKPYVLDISIGPVEHFDDEVFFAKAAYQAWVGTVNEDGTKRLNFYKKIILSARREALILGERLDNYERVKAKIIDVLVFSGLMAKTKFVGVNLPMNLNIIEKYGSEVTLFNQINDLRLKEQILPTFNKIFSPAFRKGFSAEDLRRGSRSYVALHELAHNFLYYKNSPKNLQDLLPCIYELTATLLGMRIAGSLLLQDIIPSKKLESMMVAFICRSFDLIEKSRKDSSMVNYALGGAIFINFMLESGALKQKKGMAIPNFMRIFVSLQELSYIMERLLSSGTRNDAEVFIKKYGQLRKIL